MSYLKMFKFPKNLSMDNNLLLNNKFKSKP